MPHLQELRKTPKTWLVTGASGFIGSHLLEALLKNHQKVIGLVNFFAGRRDQFDDFLSQLPKEKLKNFSLVIGDIRDYKTCLEVTKNVDFVLHQAALGNIPQSIKDPLIVNDVNVTGFLNILRASAENKVSRFVYASTSYVYGDAQDPNAEDKIGNLLSPYAVSKRTNELYGQVFYRCYGIPTLGLRYFNVFGPRQELTSLHASVIPLWIHALLKQEPCLINGDGLHTRDFCYVDNVIQANIKAALTQNSQAFGEVFNVASGKRTTLLELHALIKTFMGGCEGSKLIHRDDRPGDIKHLFASIDKAKDILGYHPTHSLEDGLKITIEWIKKNHPKT